MGMVETSRKPSFQEALAVWAKIGVVSFGGPAGQIALMHRVLVEEQRWIGEQRFLHALNFCMLLPGPEAMQLATYVGWRLHRTAGGLAAGLLFVLPGACIVLALSIAYAFYGQVPLVEIAFLGIKAAVLMIVVEALTRVGRRPHCAALTTSLSPPRPSLPSSSSLRLSRSSSPGLRCSASCCRAFHLLPRRR